MNLFLLVIGVASCDSASIPPGMVCVPAGPAIVGSNKSQMESPEHTVEISTFLIDVHEVTNAAYRVCEKARACPRLPRPSSYRSFQTDQQPATPISWSRAHAYCKWAGKRLPTEAEWEKVARGADARSYPWGDADPTCERAHFDQCKPRRTLPVGTLPPGPFGVYDMAGNGYEWVNDFATDCYDNCRRPCGVACTGLDPLGPCGGLSPCTGYRKRVLKGGSWHWPKEHVRSAWRRSERPESGIHRLSFRCAASLGPLTHAPYWHLQKRQRPDPPQPPSMEEQTIAENVPNDAVPDVCGRKGRAYHDCRDPLSYVQSNEVYRRLFAPYIENLGGAYVGIGSTQAYDFISSARSTWAWLIDHDPTIVRVHKIAHAILGRAKTPEEFISAFEAHAVVNTKKLIRQAYAAETEERDAMSRIFIRYRENLLRHFKRSITPRRWTKDFGWLSDQERFDHIRTLVDQKRIILRTGNLLTDGALRAIAEAARRLRVPVRVYYESNAADHWTLTDIYRQNVIQLPFDSKSVALRTLSGKRLKRDFKWLYLVHAGTHLQDMFERQQPTSIFSILHEASSTEKRSLNVVRLPTAGSL